MLKGKTIKTYSTDVSAEEAAARLVLADAFHIMAFEGKELPDIPGRFIEQAKWLPSVCGHSISITYYLTDWYRHIAYGIAIHVDDEIFLSGKISKDLAQLRIHEFYPGEWERIIVKAAEAYPDSVRLIRLSR